jgi:glutathione synthase/RimK-type ligase-like ATP-grasp enzyme
MKKKVLNGYRPQIRSRHPSHSPLRTELIKLPFRSIVRLGSTTPSEDNRVELNSVEAIKNSSSKSRMKKCFTEGKVQTAIFIQPKSKDEVLKFFKEHQETGIVLKSHFGSRGNGNTLVRTKEELDKWINQNGNNLGSYIVEKFYNYSREYRLHIDKNGCFYTCRKMLKGDAPPEKRWYRNNDNSVWIMDNNPQFDKPVNWDKVVEQSVKALKSCKLDFGAVDLRIQSAKDGKGKVRQEPDFIVVEINSAPSFGEVTLEKYLERIPQLLKEKHGK